MSRHLEEQTHPVSMFGGPLWSRYRVWSQVPNRTRKAAQETLGKQDFCVTLRHRHWVWEGRVEGGLWRLFGNVRGLSLELGGVGEPWGSPDLTLADKLLDDFLTRWEAGELYGCAGTVK